FFFSSRRRHTRFSRDWSSDVCSSDLKMPARPSVLNVWRPLLPSLCKESSIPISLYQILGVIRRRIMEWNRAIRQAIQKLFHKGRSEERRVGKECRARTAQDHYKKRGK